jgi:hypothetical protein
MLHFLTVIAQGDGHVASLRFANHYFPAPSDTKLDGGAGPMHADLRIMSGALSAPTRLSMDLNDASVTARKHRAAGSSKVVLVVEESEGRPEGRLTVDVASADVRRDGADTPLVRSPHVALAARARKLDLAEPFGDATVTMDMPEGTMPDLRALNPYLADSGFSMRAGMATLHMKGAGSVTTGTASGEVGLATQGAVVRTKGVDFRGTLSSNVKLPHVDLRAQRASFSGTRVELRDVGVTSEAHDPLWWGRVELEDASASFGDAPSFRAGVSTQARDGRPFLKVYAVEQESAPTWLMNIVNLDGIHGGLGLTVAKDTVEVRALHLLGGAFDIRGTFDKHGPNEQGAALVTWGPFSVAIATKNGKTTLKLLGAADWFQHATAAQNAP